MATQADRETHARAGWLQLIAQSVARPQPTPLRSPNSDFFEGNSTEATPVVSSTKAENQRLRLRLRPVRLPPSRYGSFTCFDGLRFGRSSRLGCAKTSRTAGTLSTAVLGGRRTCCAGSAIAWGLLRAAMVAPLFAGIPPRTAGARKEDPPPRSSSLRLTSCVHRARSARLVAPLAEGEGCER
jgi:hypothetical protein